jgi:hypothetical protein
MFFFLDPVPEIVVSLHWSSPPTHRCPAVSGGAAAIRARPCHGATDLFAFNSAELQIAAEA